MELDIFENSHEAEIRLSEDRMLKIEDTLHKFSKVCTCVVITMIIVFAGILSIIFFPIYFDSCNNYGSHDNSTTQVYATLGEEASLQSKNKSLLVTYKLYFKPKNSVVCYIWNADLCEYNTTFRNSTVNQLTIESLNAVSSIGNINTNNTISIDIDTFHYFSVTKAYSPYMKYILNLPIKIFFESNTVYTYPDTYRSEIRFYTDNKKNLIIICN